MKKTIEQPKIILHPDGTVTMLAKDVRLSKHQKLSRAELSRRAAYPLIVALCAKGSWEATGKKPSSVKREQIPQTDFLQSHIDEATGHLVSSQGVIWTKLEFLIPGGAEESEGLPVFEHHRAGEG